LSGGVHIALEGIDGSGLTTHSILLARALAEKGFSAVRFKEPTRGPIGGVIRLLLSGPRPRADTLALLFAADRVWNYYEAEPSIAGVLASGGVAVSDRYKYSSIAYQGVEAGFEWVEAVNSRVPDAHAIIFLDVPVEVALRRVAERGVREALEDPRFLRRVRDAFEAVLERARSRGVLCFWGSGGQGEERRGGRRGRSRGRARRYRPRTRTPRPSKHMTSPSETPRSPAMS